jgi:hypothetical protein
MAEKWSKIGRKLAGKKNGESRDEAPNYYSTTRISHEKWSKMVLTFLAKKKTKREMALLKRKAR